MEQGKPPSVKDATSSFDAAAAQVDANLVALVRHLARISAENDYQAFLKSIEKRYSGPQPKGPLS